MRGRAATTSGRSQRALGFTALVVPGTAAAHGLGGIRDLPGARVALPRRRRDGARRLVRRARRALEEAEARRGRRTAARRARSQRFLLSPWTRRVVQALSLALFAVLWSAAAFGSERSSENLTPIFVYVVFWVGMVIVTIVLGNVWSVLNPWRAAADLVAWIGEPRSAGGGSPARIPPALGVWPAVVLLGAFTVLELVWKDPATRACSREAILALQRRRPGRGCSSTGAPPGSSPATASPSTSASSPAPPSSARASATARGRSSSASRCRARAPRAAAGCGAFFAVMLGTVAFDGLSRSTWWFERIYDIEIRFSNAGERRARRDALQPRRH